MGTNPGSAGLTGPSSWPPGRWEPPATISGPGRTAAATAQPAIPPAGPVVVRVTVPARPAVLLGGPAEAARACRVEQPDRLMRVWGMLSAANGELHQVKLPAEAVARLQRQLKATVAELERSVSPALAGELDKLIRQDGTIPATTSELRIEYASLTGWTGGLVIAMLQQLEQGSQHTHD